MKIVKPYSEILTPINGEAILKHIEVCGRVCYKSEERITEDSAKTFVAGIIKRGHESVLEHYSITVRFVCDRGVSHEIVRHRIASYSQESTRYCNYGNDDGGCTFIAPCFWDASDNDSNYWEWEQAMTRAEDHYQILVNEEKATPQEARSVLPNSLKTEVIMTANLREWRHFFRLRTAPTAHPQMREVAIPLLQQMQESIPVIFDDIRPGEVDQSYKELAAYKRVKAYWDSMYGEGLEIANWHKNGDTEPFDNFWEGAEEQFNSSGVEGAADER